ncbi:hypothetical protein GOP47_0001966 [Adiantum capillus-veneris]|uniref:Uncharacterized protein n=1 Tax=Adiantum capillus-veneris TaxID=13818 RepID=A0A9D4ZNL2_ADICA|nr:hypothetical protein GOP47_0001966 [Adiantum capillus-veneris]
MPALWEPLHHHEPLRSTHTHIQQQGLRSPDPLYIPYRLRGGRGCDHDEDPEWVRAHCVASRGDRLGDGPIRRGLHAQCRAINQCAVAT